MSDSSSGPPERILVVDDNQDMCSFMQAALEGAGYEVQTAAEGAQAFARQRERPADLLITDIYMPGQEGIETIARFRAEFPPTRIIAMSGGGGTGKHDFLSAAALIGVDATLRKPFTAQELLELVRRVLQR
jgi:CheY-like chemotaxis protein